MWLTGRTIGFRPDRFGAILAGTVRARQTFQEAVRTALPDIRFLEPADSNIACFSIAADGEALSSANRHTAALYDAVREAGEFELSMTTLRRPGQSAQIAAHAARHGLEDDDDRLVLMRGVFMNPYWSSASVSERLVPDFVNALRRGIEAVGT